MLEKEISMMEKALIFLLIFSLIFLQRLAIMIGSFQIPPVFLFALFLVLVLFFLNKITIHINRLIIFFFAVFGLLISCIFVYIHTNEVGIPSLISLIVFYIPFVFIYPNKDIVHIIFSFFQTSMIIVAIMGILQFFFQVIGLPFLDPISIIPENFQLTGYYNQIPVYYGATLIKSNGMFMLEPSFYSKMLATAIIIEFLTKKRIKVLVLFFVAILFSFSGTGMILLAIAAIPILFKLKSYQIFIVVAFILFSVFTFVERGYGEYFIERIDEFDQPEKSGHIRFIAPWLTFKEFLEIEDTETILFGTGSGSIEKYYGREYTFNELEQSGMYKTAHPNSYIKLLVEYGVIGGLLFILFILYFFMFSSQNKLITFSLFINYSFLTASLLQPATVYLCLILCAMLTSKPWSIGKNSMTYQLSNHTRRGTI